MFQGLGWGDGARRHANLITVSLKLSPLDKRYHASKVGGDGASRHAHLIIVSFKTHPIRHRQEVSYLKGGGELCLQTCPLQATHLLFNYYIRKLGGGRGFR